MTIKKALLVGINAYPVQPLRGCVNDVSQIRETLTQLFGFDDANIRILLDRDATAAQIKADLVWLADGGAESDENDVRVFHFSGHGTPRPDENGDEPDGKDESIVPYDFQTAGYIIDDDLAKLYNTFPRNSNFTIIMDCCHSGTNQRPLVQDIRFRELQYEDAEKRAFDLAVESAVEAYEAERQKWVKQEMYQFYRSLEGSETLSEDDFYKLLEKKERSLTRSFDRRKGRFGDVTNRENNLLLAAALPNQTAADAGIRGDYHGAFTWHLIDAIRRHGPLVTCRDLMTDLSSAMKDTYTQVPQLEGRKVCKDKPLFAPLVS